MKERIINVLLWIWQLPQNILGIIVILFSKARKDYIWEVYMTSCGFGVSLGSYIILCNTCSFTDVKHERGHQEQSKRWGWLYLIVIGLPSALRNLYDQFFHRDWSYKEREIWYYSHFPEKQADTLGGVKRFD